jgi:hypothetical protein
MMRRSFLGACVVSVLCGASARAVASEPYSGTPADIPGLIQAEDFDDGGEGMAYHDSTPGNTGGAYRDTDVDIAATADGGYEIGWVDAGEWLQYSVNVTRAGRYLVNFRVASSGPGGTFHLEMNGADVTGPIAVPDTGGWDSWQAINAMVTLCDGNQVARLVMDSAGELGVGNFDWMQFTSTDGPGLPSFSHVYVIVMENHELGDIIGNPGAPYINWLAGQYALGTAYFGVTHPSLPNYMALAAGDTYFDDDCIGCIVDVPSIPDQIEASGLTWKAYMEDMPGPCVTSDAGLYATRHNPFVHIANIVGDSGRCSAQVVPFGDFYGDLAGAAVPNFAWITPNLCNDMHDCSIAAGDGWLSSVVPQILNAPGFDSSVLFIVWDEGTTDDYGGGRVPLIVVSPLVAQAGLQIGTWANHLDLLRTIEDAWQLPPLARAADGRPLTEYFRAP